MYKLSLAGMSLVAGIVILFASPGTADAHVCMDYPLSRVGAKCTAISPQKLGPCPVERGTKLNVFRPGETITVRLRETIDHPSHYRIAFDGNGEGFRDPVTVDDTKNDYPNILVDGIPDADEEIQEVQITFPNVETETGTLQLIQVMHDKGGNGFGGTSPGTTPNDDLYYSCADIALRVATEPAPTSAQAATVTPDSRSGLPIAAWIVLALVVTLLGIGLTHRTAGRTQP